MSKKSLRCIWREIMELVNNPINEINDLEEFEEFLVDFFGIKLALIGSASECEELEDRLEELEDSEELRLLLEEALKEYRKWKRGDYETMLYNLKRKLIEKKKKKKKKVEVEYN